MSLPSMPLSSAPLGTGENTKTLHPRIQCRHRQGLREPEEQKGALLPCCPSVILQAECVLMLLTRRAPKNLPCPCTDADRDGASILLAADALAGTLGEAECVLRPAGARRKPEGHAHRHAHPILFDSCPYILWVWVWGTSFPVEKHSGPHTSSTRVPRCPLCPGTNLKQAEAMYCIPSLR